MTGAEYLTVEVLDELWRSLDTAFRAELSETRRSVQDCLAAKSPVWHMVGRVHFNLAENRLDTEAPFAFLATYTTQVSAQARPQHVPLGQALRQYAGAANRDRLLSLLLPVQRAAEQCAWLKAMVAGGEIYHPLRWTPADAFQMLRDLPQLESAGVAVRVPGTWRANRPPRPQVSITVGGKPSSGLGTDALLDFDMKVTLEGETLTAAEIKQLLAATDGLHLVRGRWIELNREKLARSFLPSPQAARPARAGPRPPRRRSRPRARSWPASSCCRCGTRGSPARSASPDWCRIPAAARRCHA
jgi:non-specific serine/threonine protein kinase